MGIDVAAVVGTADEVDAGAVDEAVVGAAVGAAVGADVGAAAGAAVGADVGADARSLKVTLRLRFGQTAPSCGCRRDEFPRLEETLTPGLNSSSTAAVDQLEGVLLPTA